MFSWTSRSPCRSLQVFRHVWVLGDMNVSCFRYLKGTLDQYVESDYTLIYFHHGLTSENKPSLSWLRDAYREFDRK